MKVKALSTYKRLNVKDNELGRILEAGEEFEVTEERYKVLIGDNTYKEKFVEKIEEIETATIKTKVETATKRTRKKKE